MTTLVSLFAATVFGASAPSEPVVAPQPASPQGEALASVDEDELEHGRWAGSFNVGALKTEGNTDRTSANVDANAVLKREGDRFRLGAFWYYAQEGDFVTQRRMGANGQYDRFLNDKTYWFANASAEYDRQALVDLRWIAGVGLGHQFVDDGKVSLSGELGVSYVSEEFRDGTDSDYVAGRVAYSYRNQLKEGVEFYSNGQYLQSLEESTDAYADVDSGLLLNLRENMFAKLGYRFTWDNSPAAGAEKKDHQYTIGVGWTF